MKPNDRSGASSANRPAMDGVAAPAQVVEASSDLEPKLVGESLDSSYAPAPPRRHSVWRRMFSVALLGVGVLGGLLLLLHTVSANKQQSAINTATTGKSSLLISQTIPLANLGLKPINLLPETSNEIVVNGSVNIADSLVLSPTSTPAGAVAGQLYFDQARNQLGYYNGSSFVYLLQPGGGASVTNNSVTNNVTNVTNNYGTTGITAINGTAGSIAMFDGTGTLTESMITQSGSNLSTGTGVENVTIGSTSGASTTIVQGGLGNVAINTGAVSGTSGTITIESGASSTTAAGNVIVDTGESIINGTLIADKTFEDGTTDNMGNGIYGDNSSVVVSSVQAHNGTHSLAISVGSNFFPSWGLGDGTSNPPYQIRVVAGHTYALQAWVRADTNADTITASAIWSNDGYGGGGFISQQTFGTVTDNSSGWQKVAGVLTAPIGSYAMGFGFTANDAQTIGETHYFDDITITDLTTAPSEAAVNIGTTNAQVINIGNAGMLAPTSIYGSGLNLSAGAGFINGTGSYLSLSGSTGGSISTSTGALTLSSGTSASWGIGGALVGGSLTLHGGSAGGNNNGGDLILQSGSGAGTGTSGNIQITSPPMTGASGSITIESGASSTTAAGNVSIDTGNSTVTGLQASDLTFETGTDGMNFWGGTGTATQDCTQAHTGTCSLNITGFSGASAWEDSGDFGWAVTPGHLYAFSFWVKAASTVEPVSGAVSWGMAGGGWTWSGSPTITDTNTGWTQVSWTATAPAGAQYGDFELGNISGPGTTHYFDDVVATDMSSGSALSSLNLGTSNAQGINIGNASQINPTTIDGGGITLSAGQGNLNISGGATTVTASGPAAITSTGGTLTLSGAGGSGSGVIVKPQADSNTAFQVQSSSGANLFNVNTTNSAIGLGVAPTQLGYTTKGGSANTGGQNGIIMSKFTTTAAGTLHSIAVYFLTSGTAPNNTFQVALYADNAGSPGALITNSGSNTVSSGNWNNVSLTSSLAASTSYWIGITENGSTNTNDETVFDANGLGSYMFWTPGTNVNGTTVAYGAWPSTFVGGPAANVSNTNSLSTYPNITTASTSYALATDVNGHVAIGTGTPSTTFQLQVNAPSLYQASAYFQGETTVAAANSEAFNVVNGSGLQILDVDTANKRVDINGSDNSPNSTAALNVYGTGSNTILNLLNTSTVKVATVSNTGAATFENSTNSATAFQIQDSSAAAILTVDSTNKIVTVVNFVATGTLTVDGHIITGGSTPTIAAGAAACTTPTVSVSGTDTGGTITVTTGTACASGGVLATVSFASAFGAAPRVVITPGGANAAGLNAYIDDSTVSASSFVVGTGATPTATTTYKWNYVVVQ